MIYFSFRSTANSQEQSMICPWMQSSHRSLNVPHPLVMDIFVSKTITNDIDQPDHPVNDPEIINIFDVDSDENDEENWWPPVKICLKL